MIRCYFLPIATALSGVHSEFYRPMPLTFDSVSHMQPATVDKVEERWQSMNLQLNYVISNWECRDQRDDSFIEGDINGYEEETEEEDTEHEFGSTKNCL